MYPERNQKDQSDKVELGNIGFGQFWFHLTSVDETILNLQKIYRVLLNIE